MPRIQSMMIRLARIDSTELLDDLLLLRVLLSWRYGRLALFYALVHEYAPRVLLISFIFLPPFLCIASSVWSWW